MKVEVQRGLVPPAVVDAPFTARLQRALVDALVSRFENVMRVPGNPLGAEVRRFRGATAYKIRGEPRVLPNLVFSLTPADRDVLDDIVNWFREDDLKFFVEILPPSYDDELMRALVKYGLYQSDFKNEYYRAPAHDIPGFAEGVTVRNFGNDELDEFADLVLEIDETPAESREVTRRIRRAEFVDWRGYVAYVDGQPAAHCALYIHDGTGSFGFMDTNVKFRGRGAQTALLNQRIADCAEAGCELCLCQAVPGSVSARNIQRAGFHLAYTKAGWSCL